MNERWTELPVVVVARWALSQALRQWKYYADEISRVDHRHALGSGNDLEDKLYANAARAAEGMEAAADELAKAPLAPRTAFGSAHGSAALPMGMTREECVDGLRAARDMAASAEKRRDPSFVRWPDLDALIEWISDNGFPAPPNSELTEPENGRA